MMPLAPDEAARLTALYQYQILDTPPEAAFDDLARLAAHVCATPIAAINLLDAERQWCKARVGVAVVDVPRTLGCCPAVISQSDVVIIPDLAQDARFATTPVVLDGTPIRLVRRDAVACVSAPRGRPARAASAPRHPHAGGGSRACGERGALPHPGAARLPDLFSDTRRHIHRRDRVRHQDGSWRDVEAVGTNHLANLAIARYRDQCP
jgi:hypothetical protein